MQTPLGRRIWGAALLEADLEAGVTIGLAEIPADEAALLRVIRAERARKMDEDAQERDREMRSSLGR